MSAEKETIERLIGNTDFDLVHAVLSQIDGAAQMEAENPKFNLGALILALPSLQVFDARFARYVLFSCLHILLSEGSRPSSLAVVGLASGTTMKVLAFLVVTKPFCALQPSAFSN